MADNPMDPALLAQLQAAGINYNPDAPPPPAATPPPALKYQLPPDVAARVAQQNATSSLAGPQTARPAPVGPIQTVPQPQQPAPATVVAPKPVAVPAQTTPLIDPDLQRRLKETYGGMSAAVGQEQEGANQLSLAEQVASKAKADGAKLRSDQALAAKKGVDDATLERHKQFDAYQAKLEKLSDNLANTDFSPHMSVLGRIANAVQGLAGGWIAGFKGGGNPFADQMAARAKAAIDEQKAKYDQMKGKINDVNNLYAQAMKVSDNDEEAQKLAMSYAMNAAQAQADQLAAASESPTYQARAKILNAQLEQKKREIELGGLNAESKTERFTPAHTDTGVPYVDPKKIAEEAIGIQKERAAAGTPITMEQARQEAYAAHGIGKGISPYAKGNPEDKTVQEQIRSNQEGLDYLNKIRDMIKSGGELSPSRTAQGQALVAGARNALARAETGGKRAPSHDEINILNSQLPPDPNAWQFTGSDLARIEATIAQREAQLRRLQGGGNFTAAPKITPAGQ